VQGHCQKKCYPKVFCQKSTQISPLTLSLATLGFQPNH